MSKGFERVLVLGSSLTALALLRQAEAAGLSPRLYDTQDGPAAHSRCAEVLRAPSHPDDPALQQQVWAAHLEALAEPDGRTALVADSDRWLRFLQQQPQLRQCYQVLHPEAATLALLLDKWQFSQWCQANELPAPASSERADELELPLVLRPRHTCHDEALPKAVPVQTQVDLEAWCQQFDDAGQPLMFSQSLLSAHIERYSVGCARVGQQFLGYVAVMRRPAPESCAAGSCVELVAQPQVLALAEKALQKLDYQGIAEIEVLHDPITNQQWLIEINPRPWLQYALGERAGLNLLQFLRAPQSYQPGPDRGGVWLNVNADLYVCFSRQGGMLQNGALKWGDYLRTLAALRAEAYWNLRDAKPGVDQLKQLFAAVGGKLS